MHSKSIDVECHYCGNPLKRRDGSKYNGVFKYFRHFYCGKYCKGRHQIQLREMCIATNEWLYEQYWYAGKTCNDIAREIGRDPKRVWEWMRDAHIPIKPRGHDERQQFKKGDQSPFKGMVHTEETKKILSDIAKESGRIPGYEHKYNVWKGKTGPDVPSWKGGKTPERQKVYQSDEWKNAVVNVWHRDDAICQCCFKDHRYIDRNNEKFHIHHIISFQIEKHRCEIDNLVLLCEDCHRWVHGKENKYQLFLGVECESN